MPGPLLKRNVLGKTAVAAYQQVGGNPQPVQGGKIGVMRCWQATAEQAVNPVAAKFAGWQADAVQHYQGNISRIRPLVPVRRLAPGCPGQPAVNDAVRVLEP